MGVSYKKVLISLLGEMAFCMEPPISISETSPIRVKLTHINMAVYSELNATGILNFGN